MSCFSLQWQWAPQRITNRESFFSSYVMMRRAKMTQSNIGLWCLVTVRMFQSSSPAGASAPNALTVIHSKHRFSFEPLIQSDHGVTTSPWNHSSPSLVIAQLYEPVCLSSISLWSFCVSSAHVCVSFDWYLCQEYSNSKFAFTASLYAFCATLPVSEMSRLGASVYQSLCENNM